MSIKSNFKNFISEARTYLYHEEEKTHKKILVWILTVFIIGITGALLLTTLLVAAFSVSLPDVNNLDKLVGAKSTIIYDKDGDTLYTIHGAENRIPVSFTEVPQSVKDATVAIEDDRFYHHQGFDLPGIIKAVLNDLFGIGKRRGGSTITQQFVKNAFLTSERTYSRKIKELILAVRLERAFDKDKILELYLNRIPYGNNAHGIQKAAKVYFGKDAKNLTLSESAVLASLPKAPTYYSPYGEHKYTTLSPDLGEAEIIDRNIKEVTDLKDSEYIYGLLGKEYKFKDRTLYLPGRADEVLKRMNELAMITLEEKTAAVQKVKNIEFKPYREDIEAPHFVFYVKKILEEKYGKDVVESGGLKVYTTLDPNVQKVAEEAITAQTAERGKLYEYNNMASVSINVKNGHILSMVGSTDYFNDEIDGKVNIVEAPRQPGSSFKPLVYAQTFLNGYAPASVLFDVKTSFGGGEPPQNFDGEFWGPVSIRVALGESRNIPAIKAYYLAGGKDPIIDLCERMGITTLDRKVEYGWPLGIGTGETKLIEMVTAFGVFANSGIKPNITPITKIENSSGEILEEWDDLKDSQGPEVLDPQVAYLITNVLSDESVKLGEFIKLPGKKTAAKTGTASKRVKVGDKSVNGGKGIVLPTNLWAIGYTPEIVTGVWSGNADGKEMVAKASGLWASGPVWQKIMDEALKNSTVEDFVVPEGIKRVKVSKASGLLPGPGTPASEITEEVFASFNVPTKKDETFSKVQIVKGCDKLPNEYTPEDMIEDRIYANYHAELPIPAWESAIQAWAAGQAEKAQEEGTNFFTGAPPTEYCEKYNAETAGNRPTIQITSHANGDKIQAKFTKVRADVSAPNGIDRVEFYLNDDLQYRDSGAPFEAKMRVSPKTEKGTTVLFKAKIIDKLGYSSVSVISVEVE